MKALLVILISCLLAACSKPESLPTSLEDAKLAGRQWSEDDFRLAARVSLQTATQLQPMLLDLAKRGDGVAAVDAGAKVVLILHSWTDQQSEQLVEKFRPCRLALASVLDEASAVFKSGDFESARRSFEENSSACAKI